MLGRNLVEQLRQTIRQLHLHTEIGPPIVRTLGSSDQLCQEFVVQNADEGSVPISKNKAYSLLIDCTKTKDREHGRQVQLLMIRSGLDSIAILADHLIRLFASSKTVFEANQAFLNIIYPTVYTWSAIMSANASLGQGHISIELYTRMQHLDVGSDKYIHLAVFKSCTTTSSLMQGRLVHSQIITCGVFSDVVIGNTVVDMYAKCGCLEEADKLFENLPFRNVVSWNALISGYAQNEEGLGALETVEQMQQAGIEPDKITFLSALKACSITAALVRVRLIHEHIYESKLDSDLVIGNTLVDTYAKCGSLEEAGGVFGQLQTRDVVSWGAMIAGYAQYKDGSLALEYFEKMQYSGVKPNEVIFLSVLRVCCNIGAIEQGRVIHYQIIEYGFLVDVVVANTLVYMYVKCGHAEEASNIFSRLTCKSAVSWNAIISGYAQLGEGFAALELYEQMQQNGIKPNKVTFLGILKACSIIGILDVGRLIHYHIIDKRLMFDVVIRSSIIDMYAKCDSLEEARKVFDELPDQNVVLWNTMITGYAQNGEGLSALELFEDMQKNDVKPDKVTFLSLWKACGNVGAIEHGRQAHAQVTKYDLPFDITMANTLIDMYAKCGSLKEASNEFSKLTNRDQVSWNAMIAGYAQHGEGLLALDCLKKMQQDGIRPGEVSFVSILVACSRGGLLEEGHWNYELISEFQGIPRTIPQTNCMVDLLARAGWLTEAEDLLHATFELNIIGWMTLLGACKIHGDVGLARRCFSEVVSLDNGFSGSYVLMASIYANAHMQKDALEIEKMRIYSCKEEAWEDMF